MTPLRKLQMRGGSMFGGGIGRSAAILLIFVSILVITAVILYIIYLMNTYNYMHYPVQRQALLLSSGTAAQGGAMPELEGMASNSDKRTISNLSGIRGKNGHQETYTFWLYLRNYQTDSTDKRLFQVQNSGGDAYGPVVFMDAKTNRMYICTATTNSVGKGISLAALKPTKLSSSEESTVYANTGCLVVSIEYVPMQRWVHVAITLNDNTMTVFLDAEVYAARTVSDTTWRVAGKDRPMFQMDGNAKITNEGNSGRIDGYLASFDYYNYALSQKDISKVYRWGPNASTGWSIWWFGSSRLKFQWPIMAVPVNENSINGDVLN